MKMDICPPNASLPRAVSGRPDLTSAPDQTIAWRLNTEVGARIRKMPAQLGFTTNGHGPLRVLVLHDWFCDHSSWDATLPYLTPGGLIVQRIAQLAPERIARIVAITPASPAGMGLPQAAVDHFRAVAFADDDQRFAALRNCQ